MGYVGKKGVSGNPGGRPKLPEDFKELAKSNATEALKKLIEFMKDMTLDARIRVEACKVIMDRAYGKPAQPVDLDLHATFEQIKAQQEKYKK